LRKVYTKVIEDASGMGVDAWAFWHMTPRQIKGIMAACTAKGQQAAENDDRLAWMVGQYVAMGIKNPEEYPNKPNMIKKPDKEDEEQSPDDMKDRLTMFAETHNAIEEVK
jgi:hypothetical protein